MAQDAPSGGRDAAAKAKPRTRRQQQVYAQTEAAKPSLEIYGFAMLDIGHDFKQINPNWFDTLRVTRLPSVANEFGEDHSTFAGVRQSRLGVRSSTPTALGELKTTFEFELFGTGVDEGQTTFRLRHACGELGAFGAGQYWSPFSDPDVLPELARVLGSDRHAVVPQRAGPLDAGPRRRQQPDARARAPRRQRRPGRLRRPHRARRTSRPASRCPTSPAPTSTRGEWGYVRAAGILRQIKWDDILDDQFDLSGDATGWGTQPQLEPQGRRRATSSGCSSRSAKASRTT